ncbi:MAG TPA: hypothetical protein VKA73_06090 [Rubrobacter sp.]|nr:hypothetical protein [Rubrobacter sp.]
MKAVCVFCGSSRGNDPAYAGAARALGRTLAEMGTTLVYGGGHVDLMGVVADAALGAGGEVIGVMRTQMQSFLLNVSVGLASVGIAAIGGVRWISWAGFIYLLIGPLQTLNGYAMGSRWRRKTGGKGPEEE